MDEKFTLLIGLLDDHHEFIEKLMNLYDMDFPTVVAEIFETGLKTEQGIVELLEDEQFQNLYGGDDE